MKIGKKKLWLGLAALLLAGGGWWFWSQPKEQAPAVAAVKDDGRVLAEGIVVPVRYAQMVMPLEGTIGEILVQEGDTVVQNQPIIRLERQDSAAKVDNAVAAKTRATAAIEQARVNVADARRELERQRSLVKAGAAARQQLEQAETALERNQAQLAQMQADWQVQQATLQEAQGVLDKNELRAPMAGRVAYLDVRVGEHAAAGAVLVRIADESAWEVRSDDLTELSIAKVREGAAVKLTFDGVPGLEIPGKVRWIRPFGEKKRGDMTYTVTVTPERWDERLRWNMTAQLAIEPAAN